MTPETTATRIRRPEPLWVSALCTLGAGVFVVGLVFAWGAFG
jgi:hypothetical protein